MRESAGNLREYPVWDRTTRWFHWINFLSVLGLAGIGTVILFSKDLGISTDGKVLLKTIHVLVGYVFALNLFWRLVWAFIGGRYARWKTIIPWGSGFFRDAAEYARGFMKGEAPPYLGHNPLGRVMIAVLLLLLLAQSVTGLVIAGTDIYFPPLGTTMKKWIAEDPSKLEVIRPYSKENVDEERYREMKAFREPFVETHETLYFIIILAVIAHVTAAVVTDIKERNAIISAMFSGRKVFAKKPVDYYED